MSRKTKETEEAAKSAETAPETTAEVAEEATNGDLEVRLKGLDMTPEQIEKLKAEGVKNPEDMAMLSADEIKSYTGCGAVTAKKVAAAFALAPSPVEMPAMESSSASYDILPSVPEDTSFLEMLKVGGTLKIESVDVIAAMRAAIASDVGLYNLPDIILEKMESFANEQDEPVGESFYKLQKLITTRNYGEILSAIGASGNFVSDKRKREVLTKLNTRLWPALRDFNSQLTNWADTWSKGMANPGVALSMLAMAQTGARGVMPPGMMAPPETAGLRDEAEAVINRINSVFSGLGIPVARALAFDATRIKAILDEPTLPSSVGAANKDQMLKSLNVNVGPDYVRLERNIIRFALAIMELPKVSSGNEEYAYLSAMLTLGASIPWDKLGTGTATYRSSGRGTGGRSAMTGGFRDEEDNER